MPQRRRHREVLEDDEEDEQVVDRERVLDQVAGHELESDAPAVGVEEPGREGRRRRDEEERPARRLPGADRVGAPVDDAEVERQQGDDPGDEGRPQERRADGGHRFASLARGRRERTARGAGTDGPDC